MINKVRICLCIDEDLYKELLTIAQNNRWSFSETVSRVLEKVVIIDANKDNV